VKILGIDPGIAIVGFGLIHADGGDLKALRYGAVNTPAHTRLSERLAMIHDDVRELIQTLKPDAIAVEELFFNTNITTGISVAHGRGVILLAGQESGVPMFEYTPLQVKQAITGYGRAEKKQMMQMVKILLKLDSVPKPDDAADALAIAITHARFAGSLMNVSEDEVCSTI